MNYETTKYRNSLKQYRREHDCKYCKYYEKPRKCNGEFHCLIEEEQILEQKRRQEKRPDKQRKCPKDTEGNCPYGNDVGTCFGFCWQEILKEFRAKRGNHYEKEAEDKNNDG